MSWKVMEAVRDATPLKYVDGDGVIRDWKLTHAEKSVGLALAWHAHDDGSESWPSVKSICLATGLSSRRSVHAAIEGLLAKRIVEVQRPETNVKPVTYRFLLRQIGGRLVLSGRADIAPQEVDCDSTFVGTGRADIAPQDDVDAQKTQSGGAISAPLRRRDCTRTVNEHEEQSSCPPEADADDFETIWLIYPRKDDRAKARKAFDALVKGGVDLDELLTATQNYARVRQGKEPQWTMMGKTFYGPDDRWLEHLQTSNVVSESREPDDFIEETHEEKQAAMRAQFGIVDDPPVDPDRVKGDEHEDGRIRVERSAPALRGVS